MENEVDKFLGNVSETKEDPFKKEETDPFKKEEVTPEEPVEEVVEEEKSLPFHKDPKVQKFIEKEISKRLASVPPTEVERFNEETNEADEILTRIIGNDTPEKIRAIKDFKGYLGSLEEKGAQRALQQLQYEQQREVEQDRQAEDELSDGFDNIEQTFNVDLSSNAPIARKMRNEFIDFITRVSPKDEDGQVQSFPDLEETFTLFQELNKKTQVPSRAKELASRSMARSSEASSAPVAGDKSWRAVDKLFGKLSG